MIPVVVGSNPISHPTLSGIAWAFASVLAVVSPGALAGEGTLPQHAPAVPIEKLEVQPDPEDRPGPVKDRWARFAESLGPGRSAGRSVLHGADAAGVRYSCYSPCFINCCVRGADPGAVTTGRNFGR